MEFFLKVVEIETKVMEFFMKVVEIETKVVEFLENLVAMLGAPQAPQASFAFFLKCT